MPWRLIGLILIFAILLLFVGFNMGNTCDINFWFTKDKAVIRDAPVFLTVFFSVFAGMLCTLPFVLRKRTSKDKQNRDSDKNSGRKNQKTGAGSKENLTDNDQYDSSHYGIN